MNIDLIKKEIDTKLGKKVKITVYGMRNKVERYEGIICQTYPNIFTVMCDNVEKSFTYRDIITKDINLKFL